MANRIEPLFAEPALDFLDLVAPLVTPQERVEAVEHLGGVPGGPLQISRSATTGLPTEHDANSLPVSSHRGGRRSTSRAADLPWWGMPPAGKRLCLHPFQSSNGQSFRERAQ